MYLTADDVAARLNCTPRWVRLLCERGQLRHVRIGNRAIRIAEADLAAFIASRTNRAK